MNQAGRPALAVTVTAKKPGRFIGLARTKAREWGLPLMEREEKTPLSACMGKVADAFLVLGGDGWTLFDARGNLSFSPGMAAVRIKRMAQANQDEDVLVRLCELKPGDSVFDGTLGLGADALVCARAVGRSGKVVGVEASLALYALASEGLRQPPFSHSAAVEVKHSMALDAFTNMASASVDCVIFDAMFDLPKRSSPSFDMLRRYAFHQPLDSNTLEEARRVARRWVVIKGGRFGREFSRLNLRPLSLARSTPLVWARVAPLSNGANVHHN